MEFLDAVTHKVLKNGQCKICFLGNEIGVIPHMRVESLLFVGRGLVSGRDHNYWFQTGCVLFFSMCKMN